MKALHRDSHVNYYLLGVETICLAEMISLLMIYEYQPDITVTFAADFISLLDKLVR